VRQEEKRLVQESLRIVVRHWRVSRSRLYGEPPAESNDLECVRMGSYLNAIHAMAFYFLNYIYLIDKAGTKFDEYIHEF